MSEPESSRPQYVRFVKWTAIVLVALVLLIAGAIASLPLVINTEVGHIVAERIGSRALGRQVIIKGPIKLSLFPVTIQAKRVAIESEHKRLWFALMHSTTIKLHAWPLLLGKLRPYYLFVSAPTLQLTGGKTSNTWTTLFEKAADLGTRRHILIRLDHLDLKEVEIKNGAIIYKSVRKNKTLSVTHISLDASRVKLNRKFPVKIRLHLSSVPKYHADVVYRGSIELSSRLHTLALSNTTVSGQVVSRDLSKGSHPFQITWKTLQYRRTKGTLVTSNVNYTFQKLSGVVSLRANNLDGSSPELTGQVHTAQFSPRTAMRLLRHTVSPQLQGFNRLQLDGNFDVTKSALKLSHLDIRLDRSTIRGSIGRIFDSGQTHFSLQINRIDLNRYLPKWAGPAKHLTTAHSTKFLNTEVEGRLLSKFNMSGTLHISKLYGFGLHASDLNVSMSASKSKVRLQELTANVYGGHYAGDVTISRVGQGVFIKTVQDLSNVHAEPLIYALTATRRLSGTIDSAKVSISAGGNSLGELMTTAKGTIRFNLKDGTVGTFNLWRSLQHQLVTGQQEKMGRVGPSHAPTTQFIFASGHGTLSNGVLQLKSISARLPQAQVHGQARLDLNHGQVDGRLLVKVNARYSRNVGRLNGLTGLKIPVRIKGYFGALRILPEHQRTPPH